MVLKAGKFYIQAVAVLAFLSSLLCKSASGQQSFAWTNSGGNGAWTNALNWSPSSAFPGKLSTTDSAIFPAASSGTVTLTSAETVSAVTLSNNAAVIVLAGAGSNALNLSNGGKITLTNVQNGNYNDTISAPLNLLGAGTLASFNNTFAGNFDTGQLVISGSLSGSGATDHRPHGRRCGCSNWTGGAQQQQLLPGTINVVMPPQSLPGTFVNVGGLFKFLARPWRGRGN